MSYVFVIIKGFIEIEDQNKKNKIKMNTERKKWGKLVS